MPPRTCAGLGHDAGGSQGRTTWLLPEKQQQPELCKNSSSSWWFLLAFQSRDPNRQTGCIHPKRHFRLAGWPSVNYPNRATTLMPTPASDGGTKRQAWISRNGTRHGPRIPAIIPGVAATLVVVAKAMALSFQVENAPQDQWQSGR